MADSQYAWDARHCRKHTVNDIIWHYSQESRLFCDFVIVNNFMLLLGASRSIWLLQKIWDTQIFIRNIIWNIDLIMMNSKTLWRKCSNAAVFPGGTKFLRICQEALSFLASKSPILTIFMVGWLIVFLRRCAMQQSLGSKWSNFARFSGVPIFWRFIQWEWLHAYTECQNINLLTTEDLS